MINLRIHINSWNIAKEDNFLKKFEIWASLLNTISVSGDKGGGVAYFYYFGNIYFMTDWVWDNLERQWNDGVWEGEGLYTLRPGKSAGQLGVQQTNVTVPSWGLLEVLLDNFQSNSGIFLYL